MFLVKTSSGYSIETYNLVNSNKTTVINIKSLRLSLNNIPKDSGGVKKATGWKNNEIIKKNFMAPFMDRVQLLQG